MLPTAPAAANPISTTRGGCPDLTGRRFLAGLDVTAAHLSISQIIRGEAPSWNPAVFATMHPQLLAPHEGEGWADAVELAARGAVVNS